MKKRIRSSIQYRDAKTGYKVSHQVEETGQVMTTLFIISPAPDLDTLQHLRETYEYPRGPERVLISA